MKDIKFTIPNLVVTGLFVILPLLIAGCSVARLQEGLVEPSESVLQSAQSAVGRTQYPKRITTYDQFNVASAEGISISVYAREFDDAAANILFIHGAGSGAWAWEYYFELFPESINLYALSWRGHFDSTDVEDADSADYIADQAAVLSAIEKRNSFDIHLVGHSYGGATSTLQVANTDADIKSLILLAPVVPLDYTLIQKILVPRLAPFFIRKSLEKGNEVNGVYGGMFLSKSRMRYYYDLYARKNHAKEKPSLIAKDGISADWQNQLENAYSKILDKGIPVAILIARYDNVVVPRRQFSTSERIDAKVIELQSGHYIQLDVEAKKSAELIVSLVQNSDRG